MIMTIFLGLLLSFIFVLTNAKSTYYLPGVSSNKYYKEEPVKLFVSQITSIKTQMPFDYYELPFCKPKKTTLENENLGQIISGDRIENSVYKIEMKIPKICEIACIQKIRYSQKRDFIKAIHEDYKVHWILDNLPVGMYESLQLFVRGFPVGFHSGEDIRNNKHYLNNHIRIIIQYNDYIKDEESKDESYSYIVGFRVEPISIKHSYEGKYIEGITQLNTCNQQVSPMQNDVKNYLSLDDRLLNEIIFTYDVIWEKSSIEWSNRWDVYLTANNSNDKVHWFSITNSIMIVLFLSISIAVILVRVLKYDIAKYNKQELMEEANEEFGWKLVHGDVFRPPKDHPMLFSLLVGTGIQLIIMMFLTLSLAFMGLISPANRGSLITVFIFLFVFLGSFTGYYSSIIYKMFRGVDWKQHTIMASFLYPGFIFFVFFLLNLILWYEDSSGALPFATLFTLLLLWFCVSIPLVFIGSFFGYKKEAITFPVRINQIPRNIPEQPWYLIFSITCILGGLLPFSAVSVELYFIMSALWLHQIYYIFGFLFLVLIVLIIICAEVSILFCYCQLCFEDYRWWWKSFVTVGSCSIYVLLYSVWYHLTQLDMDGLIPVILYYGYMLVFSFTVFLVTGTVGFLSCFWFNNKIYSSIKVD